MGRGRLRLHRVSNGLHLLHTPRVRGVLLSVVPFVGYEGREWEYCRRGKGEKILGRLLEALTDRFVPERGNKVVRRQKSG